MGSFPIIDNLADSTKIVTAKIALNSTHNQVNERIDFDKLMKISCAIFHEVKNNTEVLFRFLF